MANPQLAIIPAAGIGRRWAPWSAIVPKELLPYHRLPLIGWSLIECAEAGIEEVVIVSSPAKGDIAAALTGARIRAAIAGLRLDERGAAAAERLLSAVDRLQVRNAIQEAPTGLGAAVMAGWPADRPPVAVLLPDECYHGPGADLPLSRLMAAVVPAKVSRIAAMYIAEPAERERYGILRLAKPRAVLPADGVAVCGLVEKPSAAAAPSPFASVGRYLLTPAIAERLAALAPGVGGEIQIADAIDGEAQTGRVRAYEIEAATRRDLGEPGLYAAAITADED